MPIIIDAHQDLAWNYLTFHRDHRRSVKQIRAQEAGTPIPARGGETMLGWPEYQQGGIAIVFATLFAAPIQYQEGDWDTICFKSSKDGLPVIRRQLDYYKMLAEESPDQYCLISDHKKFKEHLAAWENRIENRNLPVGLVISIEGADWLDDPRRLEEFRQAGIVNVMPVWASGRFCGGNKEKGGFTRAGYELLEIMQSLGFALDLSHMNEKSALQAMDRYQGVLIASHANCRSLLDDTDNERHFTNVTIRCLIERGGVIGIVPFNRFLAPNWKESDPRHSVTLEHVIAHIDHICQNAGNAQHVGLGTDFDGGFGVPFVPEELDTVADLSKLAYLLQQKGYSETDISSILYKNWSRILENSLPR